MADWQRTLDLRDIWGKVNAGKWTIQELAGEMAKRIHALLPLYVSEVDTEGGQIVEAFDKIGKDPVATTEGFDEVMERLYDWGDTKLDDNWPPKKVCWVRTT